MTCCTKILVLPCAYSCDTIQIGINTPATGNYTLELQPDSIKVVTTANTIGTPLFFAGGYLNEDATSVFKIIKPDGSYLETDDGEDCFQIDIKPTTNPTLANTDVAPLECDPATVHNSDNSFSEEIVSGGDLELEDETINVYLNSILQSTVTIPATQDNTINITIS